jgi:fatty-acyl-CoA synthase
MIGVVQALDAARGITDRGFTFVGARGPGEDLTLSFDQLRLEALRRASHLRAMGLVKGDRLALVIPEGEDFIPTFLAALWLGVVPVPLYPPVSLGKLDAFMDALVGILNVARPKALVTSERVGKVLWSAVGKVTTLERVVLTSELRADVPLIDPPPHPADDDIAFLQFTSGSTSAPKGVMVTHGNLIANSKAILHDGLQWRPGDVTVSWLPLYHDMGLIGMVLCPIVVHMPAVYIPTISFIKNATLWMETMHKHRGTMTFAPNFAYALVTRRARPEQIARWDLSRMRVFGCGAEPIQPDTIRSFTAAFAPAGLRPTALLPSYGMAEATLAMSFIRLGEPFKTDRIDQERYHADRKAAPSANGAATMEVVCCGRAFPGHELSIQDERGRLLPDRHVGEICFRGPSVTAGYWNDPETTRAAGLDRPGGWLRTGDLGYMVDGEVYISGRLKDILIVNGRNYYPQRIEWAVEELHGVRRGSAAVFSRPGKASEEVVVAVETRERDPDKLRAAIVAKVSEDLQLAVADVALVPPGSIPKTSSGKLQRRKTRDMYLRGTLGREGARAAGAMGNRLLAAKHLAYSLVGRARHEARGLMRKLTGA